MITWDLLKFWFQKWYLWVAIIAVAILGFLIFGMRRRSTGKSPIPGELDALHEIEKGLRHQLLKADNEAMVKKVRAEAKEQATQRQVDEILKIDDEKKKADLLIALRKAQKS